MNAFLQGESTCDAFHPGYGVPAGQPAGASRQSSQVGDREGGQLTYYPGYGVPAGQPAGASRQGRQVGGRVG